MKKIILGLLALVIAVGAFVMFVKKDIEVKRSTTINAPLTQVQEQIIFFKNFVKWSPWAEMDPNSKTEFSGEDGKVGAKY